MKLDEAKALKKGQTVYHVSQKNSDGSQMKAKVLSVKTWQTKPNKVLVSLKHGLYDYAKFDETQLDELTTEKKELTEVLFRVFKEGDVIAIFPYDIADNQGNVSSYQHIGQHGACDLGIIGTTKPAYEDKYVDLKAELESIGYNLKVIKKVNYKRVQAEIYKVLHEHWHITPTEHGRELGYAERMADVT